MFIRTEPAFILCIYPQQGTRAAPALRLLCHLLPPQPSLPAQPRAAEQNFSLQISTAKATGADTNRAALAAHPQSREGAEESNPKRVFSFIVAAAMAQVALLG